MDFMPNHQWSQMDLLKSMARITADALEYPPPFFTPGQGALIRRAFASLTDCATTERDRVNRIAEVGPWPWDLMQALDEYEDHLTELLMEYVTMTRHYNPEGPTRQ